MFFLRLIFGILLFISIALTVAAESSAAIEKVNLSRICAWHLGACSCQLYKPDGTIQRLYNIRSFRADPSPDQTSVPGADIFTAYPRLRDLRLAKGIQAIHKDDFKSSTELESLQIIKSDIKVIPSEVFVYATALELIDLSENKIEEIESDAFKSLTKLESVDLSDNLIRTIRSSTFSYITSLAELNLNNNNIEVIEEDAFKMQSLELLHLSKNFLHTLPEKVFSNAPRLSHLELISANLANGNALKNLKQLNRLHLSDNNRADFNLKDFIDLPSLEMLFLRNTSLKITPVNTTSNSNVWFLDLALNKIDDPLIFDKLKAFNNLVDINLEHNELKDITNINLITNDFKKLSKIYLFGNTDINAEISQKNNKLQVEVHSAMKPIPILVQTGFIKGFVTNSAAFEDSILCSL